MSNSGAKLISQKAIDLKGHLMIYTDACTFPNFWIVQSILPLKNFHFVFTGGCNKTNCNEFTRGATTFQLTKCPVVALTKQRAALGLLQANPTPEPINGEITINHDCVWIQHNSNMLTDDSRSKSQLFYNFQY